jgi:hypothetical protein
MLVLFLKKEIKTQKSIFEQYKGLVEATSPEKIIALHNQEIEQIQNIADADEKLLQDWAYELGVYVEYIVTTSGEHTKEWGDFDYSYRVIKTNFPKSQKPVEKIHKAQAAANAK